MAEALQQALAKRRSPLAGGASGDPAGTLDATQAAAIVRIVGTRDRPSLPNAITLDAGPAQWLVVAEDGTPAALMAAFERRPDHPMVTDVSHARSRIRVRGGNARRVLAHGIAIDLQPPALPPGHSTPTAYRDVAVLLHAAAVDVFDLYVLRSHAQSLWTWLAEGARQP